MYAIVIKDEKELLELAKERGFEIIPIKPVKSPELKTVNSIDDFLLALGIRPHILGFRYLKYIFENNIDYSKGVTKILYPEVAKRLNTTPARVERAIRHAIETSVYDDASAKLYTKIFGVFDKKPTNHQFLEGCKLYLEKKPIN